MLRIATLATNKRLRSINPYSVARSLQEESLRSVANAANNPVSMNYPKGFRGVMPILSGLGALSFKGMNIIEFLKRYEELSADFGLSEPEAVKRVPRYYEITIKQFIKNLPEYENSV